MAAEPPGSTANAAGFDPARDDVFARIAGRYDLMCDIFSVLAHRRWKSVMADEIVRAPGETVLDVASGTGHIALRVARRQAAAAARKRIVATDLCEEMLGVARRKPTPPGSTPEFRIADAHDLHGFETGSIDVYSMAFGMKICDRHRALREAFRVLRPGGLLLCLEASHIPAAWLRALYLRYMDWCLPVMARLATGGDRGAYDYLLRGVHDFPDQRAFCDDLRGHGFTAVDYRNLSLGIVALHRAVKPL